MLPALNSFCFMISLKICLTISLVSSSHAVTSSARIPLLSGDLPFFEFIDCSLQLFNRDLWDSRHLIGVVVVYISVAFIIIVSDFLFEIRLANCRRIFFLNSPKTLAIPERDVLISPFSFFIFVMSTFFFADLIPGMFSDTFEVFEYSLDVLLSFQFFCLWYIFCICSLLSVVVSLLWVYFSSPRWVFGFPRPLLKSLCWLSRLLLHRLHRLFYLRSCCYWLVTR